VKSVALSCFLLLTVLAAGATGQVVQIEGKRIRTDFETRGYQHLRYNYKVRDWFTLTRSGTAVSRRIPPSAPA
jgi:hypothetical protein